MSPSFAVVLSALMLTIRLKPGLATLPKHLEVPRPSVVKVGVVPRYLCWWALPSLDNKKRLESVLLPGGQSLPNTKEKLHGTSDKKSPPQEARHPQSRGRPGCPPPSPSATKTPGPRPPRASRGAHRGTQNPQTPGRPRWRRRRTMCALFSRAPRPDTSAGCSREAPPCAPGPHWRCQCSPAKGRESTNPPTPAQLPPRS
mmetsp:Transcript_94723/g.253358  ORF Transcript_94723/g.253358 Transcript_94723/m.253358 type:complete len:200 (-) Transcript_94723:251-850(-)